MYPTCHPRTILFRDLASSERLEGRFKDQLKLSLTQANIDYVAWETIAANRPSCRRIIRERAETFESIRRDESICDVLSGGLRSPSRRITHPPQWYLLTTLSRLKLHSHQRGRREQKRETEWRCRCSDASECLLNAYLFPHVKS